MALDLALTQSLNLPAVNQFGFGLFQPHNRSIAGFHAEITVEETERDEVTVTEHPVEQGAPISDHAFKRPEEVIVRVGWSIQGSGDLSADSGVYGFLLNLQASFQLFDLITGKRIHKNMLITSMWVTTDATSEYALLATLACREVILTQTQTGTTTGLASNQSLLQNSSLTGAPLDQGLRQPSILGSGLSSSSGDTRVDLITGTGDFTIPNFNL